MKKLLLFPAVFLLFAGCGDKPARKYDGEALLKQKCAACHNLDMPPKTYPDEKAPPMMAVTFHVRDFMKVDNPSEKRRRFIEFVVDYALHPSAEKSFCDKKSLEDYGLMPSLEGKVTPEELEAVAGYMYDHYDPEKFMKLMQEQARLAALPAWQRVTEQKNCLGCHGIDKDKIAPAFSRIAERYGEARKGEIIRSIKEGSRGKWEGFKLAMPPFRDLDEADLSAVAEWIVKQGRK